MMEDRHIPESTRHRIEQNFHALIKRRSAEMNLHELPELPSLNDTSDSVETSDWFDVPGMYGGFSYWFDRKANEHTLIAESWSRIVGGSGQRHMITASGVILVEEGFV